MLPVHLPFGSGQSEEMVLDFVSFRSVSSSMNGPIVATTVGQLVTCIMDVSDLTQLS